MFRPGLTGKQQIEQLETAFGFDWDDQDWGIVNADATRIAEFLTFFDQNYDEHWLPSTVGEFVDLVMESASDAMRSDPNFPIGCIDRFVAVAAPIAPERVAYWTSHDWPVTAHLRELGV